MAFGLPQKTITQLKSVFKKYPEITQVKIYGSRATGQYRRGSDIDLAFFSRSGKDLSSNLLWELDDLPTPYLFDLVNYNTLDENPLKEEIDKYGTVLYRKNTVEHSAPLQRKLNLSSENNSNHIWQMKHLGKVCTFEYGKPLKKEDRRSGKYPVFGSNGIVDYHNKYLIKGPCIIVGRKGTAGEVTYSESKCFPIDTTFYVNLKSTSEYNMKYLYFMMKTLNLKKISTQSNVPGLNRNDVYKEVVPCPPLPEQKKIAGILSQIQKAIEIQDKLIKTTKELKQTTMKQLFTYGVRDKKTKQTEIGQIPEETLSYAQTKWLIVKLDDISKVSSGNSAPQDKSLFNKGKYPFCRTSDVGKIHISDNFKEVHDYLNDVGVKKLTLFKQGTILFPKSGVSTFLNHRVMLGIDSYVSNHLATIYPNQKKVIPKFLFNLLCLVDAKKLTNDHSYPSLKLSEIKKIKISLPPLLEQEKIADILTKIDQKIETHRKKRSSLEELFKTALHQLMTGKIRVHKLNINLEGNL